MGVGALRVGLRAALVAGVFVHAAQAAVVPVDGVLAVLLALGRVVVNAHRQFHVALDEHGGVLQFQAIVDEDVQRRVAEGHGHLHTPRTVGDGGVDARDGDGGVAEDGAGDVGGAEALQDELGLIHRERHGVGGDVDVRRGDDHVGVVGGGRFFRASGKDEQQGGEGGGEFHGRLQAMRMARIGMRAGSGVASSATGSVTT